MISIKGLHKYFNRGRQNEIHVINDVSLDLPEKGMVAIFGRSGCGKTTLLNVIGGLDRFAGGTLTVENNEISKNTDIIRNKYIGYIFQNYNLHKSRSCFENVADALRLCGMTDEAEISTRVTAALKNVGMENYSSRTPDTLSGGQQQRIAIARAIVKNPRIILADEPTGNLDEANTVMIMDLLKAISKEHLVVLVTHEANLVDYYCDTVIELSDGKVVGIRNNSSAQGFAAKDKNDIYLGELPKTTFSTENAEIEYYGEPAQNPIRFKIVNNGGKIYLQLDDEKINVIDRFSEIKLREGVYEEKSEENAISRDIDMSALPEIKGTRFGRLFNLKSSIKSGYAANFKEGRRSKKMLRRCLCLFSSVIVFMSSVFGTAFRDIFNAEDAYNHNVFYLYTPTEEISNKLALAVGDADSGIDHIHLTNTYPHSEPQVLFNTGTFETFSQQDYVNTFSTNAVYFDVSLLKDANLLCGRMDSLRDNEMVITRRVAEKLIEKTSLGYIDEIEDLIGMTSTSLKTDDLRPRIVGVIDSDEPAIYLTEMALAKQIHSEMYEYYISLASDYGISLSKGETILAIKNKKTDVEYPKINETVMIQGEQLTVVDLKEAHYTYSDWLIANGIEKKDMYNYFSDIVKTQNPTFDTQSEEFFAAVDKIKNEELYLYYDYLYSEIDSYYKDYAFFDPQNFEIWLYLNKGIEAAKFIFLPEDYYKACVYKNLNGRYPTYEELSQEFDTLPYLKDDLDKYYISYSDEFYKNEASSPEFYFRTYLVSDSDYIAFTKQLGETDQSAKLDDGNTGYYNALYTVIHSNDPQKTDTWLKNQFSDLNAPNEYLSPLLTPESIFDDIIKESALTIATDFITLAILLVIMGVCMHFIMKSSMINRIKEIGIYRAIGVSKKNLIFKFVIESAVLTTLTVFIGYLVCSAFMFICLASSSIMSSIFYYPVWMALIVLAILYAFGLFFGVLPIIMLLRKTPSEILAKYDI